MGLRMELLHFKKNLNVTLSDKESFSQSAACAVPRACVREAQSLSLSRDATAGPAERINRRGALDANHAIAAIAITRCAEQFDTVAHESETARP